MKTKIIAIILIGLTSTLSAQSLDAKFFDANPDAAGGIYYTYRFSNSDVTPAPKGYKPFYVSHFGRHGSRWHASKGVYTYPQQMLNKAAKEGELTEVGKILQQKVDAIARRAYGREAELSPQGIAEHRGIAERMYYSFPKLFKGKDAFVESRSSDVPRCILSMAAFNERLKEINPKLKIYRTTNDSVQVYLRPSYGRKSIYKESHTFGNSFINPKIAEYLPQIARRIYSEKFIEAQDSAKLFSSIRTLFYLAICIQDTEGDLRIHDIFTGEERAAIWEAINKERYANYGASVRWGDAILGDGANLIREVVMDADRVIEEVNNGKTTRTAFLRFGHDYTVISALAVMQAVGKCARVENFDNLKNEWQDFNISPMAANIQWIFYRNKAGEVIVKLLHNEEQTLLPIQSDIAPYYKWEDVRKFFNERIAQIANLPAVKALPKDRFYTVGK